MTAPHQPIRKTVKPINFLFHRAQVTLAQLSQQVPLAKKLFAEAVAYDLHVTGPAHWHYFGFMGDESQPFTLEVCLPVASTVAAYDGPFHFKRTEPFTCVSLLHEGGWQEIPRSYQTLMAFVAKNQWLATGVNRELYLNADFQHPDANVTEIQLGVTAAQPN